MKGRQSLGQDEGGSAQGESGELRKQAEPTRFPEGPSWAGEERRSLFLPNLQPSSTHGLCWSTGRPPQVGFVLARNSESLLTHF